MDVYSETEVYRIVGIVSTLIPELHNIRVDVLDGAIQQAFKIVEPLDADEDFEFKEERTILLNCINNLEEQIVKLKEDLEDARTTEE